MAGLSPAGHKKLAAQVFLFVINIVVLALAAQVNKFQDFFYVADLFPLGLSIATFVLLVYLFVNLFYLGLLFPYLSSKHRLATDLSLDNTYTGRAHMETGIFGILSIFWLCFSAFSTSRWQQVPFQCAAIPADFSDERTWCKSVQVLKGFVWIEFVTCFIIAVATFSYAVVQSGRGNKHIWQVPLSRYRPQTRSSPGARASVTGPGRDSEFLQYDRFD